MRLSAHPREEDPELREASIEARRVVRPLDAADAVPEGLRVVRIEQQDPVGQDRQASPRHRMDPGFVEEQPTDRGGIDRIRHG